LSGTTARSCSTAGPLKGSWPDYGNFPAARQSEARGAVILSAVICVDSMAPWRTRFASVKCVIASPTERSVRRFFSSILAPAPIFAWTRHSGAGWLCLRCGTTPYHRWRLKPRRFYHLMRKVLF